MSAWWWGLVLVVVVVCVWYVRVHVMLLCGWRVPPGWLLWGSFLLLLLLICVKVYSPIKAFLPLYSSITFPLSFSILNYIFLFSLCYISIPILSMLYSYSLYAVFPFLFSPCCIPIPVLSMLYSHSCSLYAVFPFLFSLCCIPILHSVSAPSSWLQYFPPPPSRMVGSDFAGAAALITMGAVLGRASPFQLIIITFFELVFYSANEAINLNVYHAADVGGSMLIHTFGAYFGLAVSFVLYRKNANNHTRNSSRYDSDLFAMIGQ